MIRIEVFRQQRNYLQPESRFGNYQQPELFFAKCVDVDAEEPLLIPTAPVNHRDNFDIQIYCDDARQCLDATQWRLFLGKGPGATEKLGYDDEYLFTSDSRHKVMSRGRLSTFLWLFEEVFGEVHCRLDFKGKPVIEWKQDVRVEDNDEICKNFDAIRIAIGEVNHALFLDFCGKGTSAVKRGTGSPSVEQLQLVELHTTFEKIRSAVHVIQTKPHSRMIPRLVRESAHSHSTISDHSLRELCINPDILIRRRDGKVFLRENIVEMTSPTHDSSENRMILEFLCFLDDKHFRILHNKLNAEIEDQAVAIKAIKSQENSWKSQRQRERDQYVAVREKLTEIRESIGSELRRLKLRWKIGQVVSLSRLPAPTPLIRKHKGYFDAYQTIYNYFSRFHLENESEEDTQKHGIINIPKMYEYWCLIHIVRVLRERLIWKDSDSASNLNRLLLDRNQNRLKVRFSEEAFNFLDGNGNLLRLFYEKKYYTEMESNGALYGRCGKPGAPYCPDFSLEIFKGIPPAAIKNVMPMAILFFDAKYSAAPHMNILRSEKKGLQRYRNINMFSPCDWFPTQVWGLVSGSPRDEECDDNPKSIPNTTLDDQYWDFWDDEKRKDVLGTIQVAPSMETDSHQQSPFRRLVDMIFPRLGIVPCVAKKT
jgi:hypothetical protein